MPLVEESFREKSGPFVKPRRQHFVLKELLERVRTHGRPAAIRDQHLDHSSVPPNVKIELRSPNVLCKDKGLLTQVVVVFPEGRAIPV